MKPVCIDRRSVAERLRHHGIAPTHQRVEIAFVLLAWGKHVSADQLFSRVNATAANCSKATVYNTLKLFKEKAFVREVIVDPARVFYDPNTMPHHHYFDLESGELTDIDADPVQVAGLPALPDGMVQEGLDIVVRIRRG